MDACSAVGRDIDKVLSKFTTFSDHESTTLDSLQNNIESLKSEIEQVGYGDVTEAQAVILTQALGKVKEAVSRLSIEHRDLHSSVSRVGKAVDKNFTADFGCLANDEVLTGDKQHLVNEVICQHFYREGLLDIAEEHIKETGLELPQEAREPFFELNRILGALKNRDLGPALSWAQENRDKLRAQNSSLEFKLHRLAYISLLSQQPVNVSQAIEYARAHFTPFVYHHEKEDSSTPEDKDVLMTETDASLEGILEQPESSKKRHRSSRSSQAPKKKSRTGQTSSPSPPYKDDLVLRVHLEELDDESVSPSSEDVAYIRKKGEEACLKELDFRPQIPPPIMCRGFIKFVCADKKNLGWLKKFIGSLKGPGFGHPGYLALGPGDRPPMTKYLIRIPSGIEASDLLSLLVAHNEAIANKRFEIRKVFPGINGNTALVGCDADVVELLEGAKYQLSYGQGFITFKKKPTAVSNRDSEEARVIQSLMGCLLYVKGGLSNSPYAHLLSASQWTEICEVFTKDACSLLGLSVDSSLAVCVNAGCTALPVLLNIKQVMAQRQVHNMWNTKEELPIEIDLGPTCRYHSIFACPILRQQSTESNPPMRLICGHVISRDALNKLTTGNKLKCPYCPVEQNPGDAQQIYF